MEYILAFFKALSEVIGLVKSHEDRLTALEATVQKTDKTLPHVEVPKE